MIMILANSSRDMCVDGAAAGAKSHEIPTDPIYTCFSGYKGFKQGLEKGVHVLSLCLSRFCMDLARFVGVIHAEFLWAVFITLTESAPQFSPLSFALPVL